MPFSNKQLAAVKNLMHSRLGDRLMDEDGEEILEIIADTSDPKKLADYYARIAHQYKTEYDMPEQSAQLMKYVEILRE